jgi:hypothetical protein
MKPKADLSAMIRNFILNLLEVYGSKVSQWAWRKRWNRKNGLSRKKSNE